MRTPAVLDAVFSASAVILMMTTAAVILAILALAFPHPSLKHIALCVGVGVIGLIATSREVYRATKRRTSRETLARFMREGALLAKLIDVDEPPTAAEVDDWEERLDEYVSQNLSRSDATRLNIGAGLPQMMIPQRYEPHGEVYLDIYYKVARLAELLSEQ